MEKRAFEVYQKSYNGKQFQLMHCFNIMRKFDKWSIKIMYCFNISCLLLGCPLLFLLCFNGLFNCRIKSSKHELEQPLLPHEQKISGEKVSSTFNSSSSWSKITFLWLNPIFVKYANKSLIKIRKCNDLQKV